MSNKGFFFCNLSKSKFNDLDLNLLRYNILKVFEMKTINSRQIQEESQKMDQKVNEKPIMPFLITRQPYRQLIAYQKKGHWSEKQKLKYAVFVEYFKQRFQIRAKRRFNNIFDLMAIFIKTRNAHQCRSHHQKMEKEKFRVDSILIMTASKYHPRVYQELKDRYISEIQGLDIDEEQNFEQFRKRIQKIQLRKSIEKQIMANNKRVLRSHRAIETKKIKNSKKQNSAKKVVAKSKPVPKVFHRCIDQSISHPKVKKEEQQPTEKEDVTQKAKKQYIEVPMSSHFEPSAIRSALNQSANRNENEYEPNERIQFLERIKKQHLESANFHYGEYLRHMNEVNTIQFQIMKENSLRGVSYPFYH